MLRRIGGDEFIVYLGNVTDKKDAEAVAGKLCTAIRRLSTLKPEWSEISASIGISFADRAEIEMEELYIAADREMREVMTKCPGIDFEHDYESALEHYGVKSAHELTEKIRSIPSFKSITSPMKEENGKWVPDFSSRYFTEDIEFGTKTIQAFARRVGVATPIIDKLITDVEGL